ncbi:hypothetical protein IT570_07475 [Candidatus Sumerlaeota bacterium]|nr:hypothetical protein [Candidatus Sumerlaeota bacterium]
MKKILGAVVLLTLSSTAFAQVATVDGVGGVATGDARYPLSYATVGLALTDVKLPANDVAGGNTINVTAQTVTEAAGLVLNTANPLTLQGAVSSSIYGGTLAHLKVTPTGVGLGGGVCAFVLVNKAGATITLRDLIITPSDGVAGGVSARAIQSYNDQAGTISTTTMERVMITAVRPTGHPNAGDPITNPLVHAASVDTRAARYAELRSFSGGGGNNLVEFRNNAAPTAGAVMTYNLTDFVVTHALLDGAPPPAPASRGGGIVISRTAEITVNISGASVISFNDGSGIRGVGTLSNLTTALNITGTQAKPVIFYKNGWMEDTANTARNEGIQNDGTPFTIDHAYFIANFQEGIDKVGNGGVTITNSYFAENQTDLDTGSGTAPNGATAANLKLSGAGPTYALTNVTVFDNKGGSNANAINFTGPAASTLNMNNVVLAGTGDLGTIGGVAASAVNDTDVAYVATGPHATGLFTFGAGVTRTSLYLVSDDPLFVSTTFAPTWNGLGNAVTGLDDYLKVSNTAYNASRTPGASNLTGANPFVAAVADWTVLED